jgi:hypothetical protein
MVRSLIGFRSEDMTGAKLLGMHETVSSPKEYRSHPKPFGSHGDAGVV